MPQITLNPAQVKELSDFCHKHNLSTFFLAKDEGAYVGEEVKKLLFEIAQEQNVPVARVVRDILYDHFDIKRYVPLQELVEPLLMECKTNEQISIELKCEESYISFLRSQLKKKNPKIPTQVNAKRFQKGKIQK